MAINDELTRIETAKADIKSAIVECGVDDIEDLTSALDKIEVYANYIRQIPLAVFSTLKIKLTGSVTSEETGFNTSGLASIATTTNHTHKSLANYYTSSTRPATCDYLRGDGTLTHFKATSTMTTSKPPSDAHVLHFAWDNTGGWESQLAISTSKTPEVYIRGQASKTWGDWITLLSSENCTSVLDDLYLPLTGGTLTGDLSIVNTEGNRTLFLTGNNASLRLFAWGDANYIESGDSSFSANKNLKITGIGGNTGSNLYLNFANIYCRASNYVNIDSGNYTTYTPILNSSSTHATKSSVIYAPTSAGTSGLYLVSNGSGAPSWKTINPYDANISRTANTVLAAPNGSAGVATFRKLVMADLPDITVDNSSSGKPVLIRGGNAAGAYKPYCVTGIVIDVSTKTLRPDSNKAGSLGTSSLYWGNIYGTNLYATTNIYFGKATIYPPDATSGTFNFYFPNTGGTFVTHETRGSAVGGTSQPVYIAATGRATPITTSITAGNIIQLSTGTISHASTYSCGGNTQFIYATGGKLTATTVDKGSSSQGVYMKAGVMTAMTYSLNATVNAASTAGVLAYYSSTTAIGPFTIPAASGTIYVTGSSSSKLYYASGVYIESGKTVKASSFYETSDARLKDFYDDVEVDLEKLALIPKKYFKWKLDGNKLEIGTSAQEILKIYPELVDANEDGILTVSYSKLSIVALKGIDKLYEEVKQLKDKVHKLESKI